MLSAKEEIMKPTKVLSPGFRRRPLAGNHSAAIGNIGLSLLVSIRTSLSTYNLVSHPFANSTIKLSNCFLRRDEQVVRSLVLWASPVLLLTSYLGQRQHCLAEHPI
jgi:hypothetical protein